MANPTAPEPGWTPTDEVFKDPGTDRLMRVWLDRTGRAPLRARRPTLSRIGVGPA